MHKGTISVIFLLVCWTSAYDYENSQLWKLLYLVAIKANCTNILWYSNLKNICGDHSKWIKCWWHNFMVIVIDANTNWAIFIHISEWNENSENWQFFDSMRCINTICFLFIYSSKRSRSHNTLNWNIEISFFFSLYKKKSLLSSWCGRPNGKTATQLSPLKSAKIFSLYDFCFVYFVSSFSYHFSWMYVTNNVHLVTIIAAFIVDSTHRVTRSERKMGKMKNVFQI